MLTEQEILEQLDGYIEFIELNHPYIFLIDSRLNVFRNGDGQWCVVSEVLGYNPRGDSIALQMNAFGNHFLQYEESVYPIDWESFFKSIDGEVLQPDAKYWLVRETKTELSHSKPDYEKAGIELSETEPGEIRVEEAARLIIITHQHLFRATDEELHRMVPGDMEKILVLDEWFYKEREQLYQQHISPEKIDISYALSKHFTREEDHMDFDTFAALYKQKEQRIYDESLRRWEETKPSSYETWQQIAKVIVTGDTSFYKPATEANSHWKFWPESGSM